MKIFIDPGHGGSDPGAVSKIKEADYTLTYARELGRVLALLGFLVSYSRTTDTFASLSERCQLANNWGADYFISIHFNAGGGIGIETFAYSAGGNGEKLANAVQIALIKATGAIDRGRKFANYQVLRDTNMSAILIEGGFIDSDTDSKNIQTEEYKRKYIQGATKGLCAFTGVMWKDPYTVVDKTAQAISLLNQAIQLLS
jgi:N-acetylmuramoyl-L-alanine amidase